MIEQVKLPTLTQTMWAKGYSRIPPQWYTPIEGMQGVDDAAYYSLPPSSWPGLEVVGPANMRRSLMAPVQALDAGKSMGCCGAEEAPESHSVLKLVLGAAGAYLVLKMLFG